MVHPSILTALPSHNHSLLCIHELYLNYFSLLCRFVPSPLLILPSLLPPSVSVLPRTHFDDGEKELNKTFGCALVVGIEEAPLKITKAMGAKRIARRSRVLPFIKVINYRHMMPTRYTLDTEFKNVTSEMMKDPATKKEVRKEVRKVLEEKYKTGQNKWFFQKLRF